MVNLLYGNNIGISAKKSSSYSSSWIARMARLASGGFREGGNLPFCSHDSTYKISNERYYNSMRSFTLCYQFLDIFDSNLQVRMEHCLQRGGGMNQNQTKRMYRSQQTDLVNNLLPLTTFRCAILSFSFLAHISIW